MWKAFDFAELTWPRYRIIGGYILPMPSNTPLEGSKCVIITRLDGFWSSTDNSVCLAFCTTYSGN